MPPLKSASKADTPESMSAEAAIVRRARLATEPDPYSLVGTDTRPIPDPTALTTKAVDRATEFIREIYDARLDTLHKEIDNIRGELARVRSYSENRRVDIEAAVQHVQDLTKEQFSTTDSKIDNLYASIDRRFESSKDFINERFNGFKTLVEQVNKLNSIALDAALTSSKEAAVTQQLYNDKQVTEVTKRLDLIGKGLEDKIEGLKGSQQADSTRITAIESRTITVQETKGESHSLVSHMIAAISVIISIIAIISVLFVAFFFHSH